MYIPIVRPSDLETTLNTSDSFTFSDRDSDQRPGGVYGLVVMGQGEGGILVLSWGCSYIILLESQL